jgi:hypothetical protein
MRGVLTFLAAVHLRKHLAAPFILAACYASVGLLLVVRLLLQLLCNAYLLAVIALLIATCGGCRQ